MMHDDSLTNGHEHGLDLDGEPYHDKAPDHKPHEDDAHDLNNHDDENDDDSHNGHHHGGPNKQEDAHDHGHTDDVSAQSLSQFFQKYHASTENEFFNFVDADPQNHTQQALNFLSSNTSLNFTISTSYNEGSTALAAFTTAALLGGFEGASVPPLFTPKADSVPANNTTTAAIEVNSQITGTIEDLNDQDFYKVELTAGVTYEFYQLRGGDNPMEDPYIRLFDTDGVTELAENDDILNAQGEQASRNSKITYIPTESGTYFIAADKWIPTNDSDATGDYTIYVNADGYRPDGTLDELAFFLTDQFDNRAVWNQTTITYDVSNLPSAVKTLALAAMQLWEDVTPLNFIAATPGANAALTFTDNDSGAFASTSVVNGFITSSRINISDEQWVDVHGTDFNSYTFGTYIHEIGHALGLGHGGPYNGNATYGVDNVYSRDLANFSVMSYNDQLPSSDAAFQGTPRLVLGIQIVDLIAIHDLYGTNPEGTREGSTVYGFNSNAGGLFDFADFNSQGIRPPALSIYDTGGYDTLDLSGYSAPQRISLIAETFSDIGNNTNLGGNVPLINLISIARDTVIEAAIGGSGGDTITGNEANNNLRGEAGADYLDGGLGNDTLTGGTGDDVFVIKTGSSDIITDFLSGDMVVLSAQNITSFQQLTAASTQEGADVVINIGDGETLTLKGVILSELSAADFEFTEFSEAGPTPPAPTPAPPSDQANPAILVDAIDHIFIDHSPLG